MNDKGKRKVSMEEIRDHMKKTWVKKSESEEGNKSESEATSGNSSDNSSRN